MSLRYQSCQKIRKNKCPLERKDSNLLVKRILNQESQPVVEPVTVDQKNSLEMPELRDREVGRLRRRVAFAAVDADADVSLW